MLRERKDNLDIREREAANAKQLKTGSGASRTGDPQVVSPPGTPITVIEICFIENGNGITRISPPALQTLTKLSFKLK